MQSFGDPDRFQISACWMHDDESRDCLPKSYGWSMGMFSIRVGGIALTEHRIHGQSKQAIHWYLGPVVHWLLSQWKWLMHEEAFSWSTHSGDSAAFTVEADIERYIASEYPRDRVVYKEVRAWWMRHSLRAADPSALFPSVFFRRVEDSIEVSWADRQPEFAPDGFELNLSSGVALFLVDEVAGPLWDFLHWAIESAQPVTDDDREQVRGLRHQLEALKNMKDSELESVHVTAEILRKIQIAAQENRWVCSRKMSAVAPVVTEFDMPVLMFGGLGVNLGSGDVRQLFDILTLQSGRRESELLAQLVSFPSVYEYLQPFAHGYELAYQVRQALQIDLYTAFVDIDALLQDLGVRVFDKALETSSIRGVAIAGDQFCPAIVVNTSHKFNSNVRGRRFTLAHELCHILFDRTRAKRLSHMSGPWTSGRVEKRANAFAALFLATPHALERAMSQFSDLHEIAIERLASKFGIGKVALREHLLNLDLTTDAALNSFSIDQLH